MVLVVQRFAECKPFELIDDRLWYPKSKSARTKWRKIRVQNYSLHRNVLKRVIKYPYRDPIPRWSFFWETARRTPTQPQATGYHMRYGRPPGKGERAKNHRKRKHNTHLSCPNEWQTRDWRETGYFVEDSSNAARYSCSSTNAEYVSTHAYAYDQYKARIDTQSYSEALVDRGANGGFGGADVRFQGQAGGRTCDVTGIGNYKMSSLPVGTCTAWTESKNRGPCVLVFHQYAFKGEGKSIHSSLQMEQYGNRVHDGCVKLGGKQYIETLDGYILPISIRKGLPYIEMRPDTEKEFESLPHVVMTSDMVWEPTCCDVDAGSEEWERAYNKESRMQDDYGDNRFSLVGDYLAQLTEADFGSIDDQIVARECLEAYKESVLPPCISGFSCEFGINKRDRTNKDPDYHLLRPRFAWLSAETIKKTFDKTTQWAKQEYHVPFRRHYKSRFPAHNVSRRHEPVATDFVKADTPAFGCGSTAAQLFVGRNTLVTDVYGCKTDAEFAFMLEENIRRRGAMDKLISDSAKSETSKKVLDILRSMFIEDWQSEPHHQWQNFAENRWQTLQNMANNVLNRTGAPDGSWLLCLQWLCYILNHTATKALNWEVPITKLTGQTPDISAILQFSFWEPVYFATNDGTATYPSTPNEAFGYFAGISEHVGDALTFLVWNPETKQLLHRSDVRAAMKTGERNLRLVAPEGEDFRSKPIKEVIKSGSAQEHGRSGTPNRMPTISPEECLGRTYLTQPDDDGTRYRATVKRIIETEEDSLKAWKEYESNPLRNKVPEIKFIATTDDRDKADEIIGYNDLLTHFENEFDDDDPNRMWRYKEIIGHQGPLKPNDKGYKGSMWNVQVAWEDGSVTFEPLSIIGKDSPVFVAQYAKKHRLYDKPGWKRYKHLATRSGKTFERMVRQMNKQMVRDATVYQFGFQVPKNDKDAIRIDKMNGNTLWQDAMTTELKCLQDYETFRRFWVTWSPSKGSLKI